MKTGLLMLLMVASLWGCAAQETRKTGAMEHWTAGESAYRARAYEEARGHFEALVALAPEHEDAWLRLGNIAMIEGRLDDAEAAYRIALRLRPRFAKAHYNLALTYLTRAEDHFLFYAANGGADGRPGGPAAARGRRLQDLLAAIETFSRDAPGEVDPLVELSELLAGPGAR